MLAFIYVPLNLATSIFGMNIKQFGQRGPNIWIFVVTTAVAVVLTLLTWATVDFHRRYHEWKAQYSLSKEHPKSLLEGGEEYTISKILVLFFYVVRNHTLWAWRSNAGKAILIDGQCGEQYYHNDFHLEKRPDGEPPDPRNLVCDYVYRHSWNRSDEWFPPDWLPYMA